MAGGGLLTVIGVLSNLFLLLKIYGIVGRCFDDASNNSASCAVSPTLEAIIYIVKIATYAGITMLIAGVILRIFMRLRKPKDN
jgi:hypothetical protein